MLAPYLEGGTALVDHVATLMAAAEDLEAPSEEGADEEPRLLRVLSAMKAVGASAEPLRSAPSEVLTKAVQSLMRILIDGVYLWVSDQNRTREAWVELVSQTERAVNGLSAALQAAGTVTR